MNEILKFEGAEIRMIDRDGEPWWVAKDVCAVLGIENVGNATARIDEDDIRQMDIIDAIGRKQKTSIVNEPGLYSLILRSEKPEAKRMKNWLTKEVLPSIRKTGSYSIRQEPEQDEFTIMRNMINVLEASRKKIAALEDGMASQNQHIRSIDSYVNKLDHRVDLFGADTHFRTIRAYCNQHKLNMSERQANALGRKAGKLCRDRGIEIGKVSDERHGSVNSYPMDIIAEAVAIPPKGKL